MNDNFDELSSEDLDLINRFEQMLESNKSIFFDLSDYETIIDYYANSFNYSQALVACDVGIAQYPFSTQLLIDKAQVLAMLGAFDEALVLVEEVAELEPDNEDVPLTRGIIFNQKGDFALAINCFKQAVEQSEVKDDIYFNIGLSYQSWGKFKAAMKYYKKSLRLNIQNELALQELLYCLEITGEGEGVVAFFQEFVDKDPYSPIAWFTLGLAQSRLANYEQAIGAYEYATLIKPDFAAAHVNLANNFVYLGEFTKAIESFQAAADLDEPNPDILCNIGECYEKLMQWDLSHRYYQKAIDLAPEMDEAWFGIGVIMDLQEKWMEAVHYYRKAISFFSDNSEYWLALAAAEYQLGNVISSVEAYEQASTLEPENKDIWLNWSIILYEQGNFEGAIDLLMNAVELQPDEAELLYRLCAYSLAAGKYKQAYNYLENALILNFDKHKLLFEFFPELESQRALSRLIDQYRK